MDDDTQKAPGVGEDASQVAGASMPDSANAPQPRQKTAEQSRAQTRASLRDRMAEWIAGYEHGLQHNSPRTQGELDRLKELLGWNPPIQPAVEEGR